MRWAYAKGERRTAFLQKGAARHRANGRRALRATLVLHFGYLSFIVKQTLISISKVQIQQDESELSSIETQETAIIEELAESTDIVEPKNVKYAGTYHNGWKVSEILREIRLDNFEMGSVD